MKPHSRAAMVAVTLFAVGCADRGRPADIAEQRYIPPPPNARGVEGRGVDSPLVIVTIDGVRWQEVFNGSDPGLAPGAKTPAEVITPNLHKLGSERGAFIGA